VDATPRDDLHLRDFSGNPSPRCYRGELTLVNPGTYHYRYRTRGKRRTTASQSLSLKHRNNRRCNPCEPGVWDDLEESEFEEYSRGNGEKKRSRPYYGQEFIEILGHEDIWRDVSTTMCALHIGADLIVVPTCVAIAAPDGTLRYRRTKAGITTEQIKPFSNQKIYLPRHKAHYSLIFAMRFHL